jgi:hypothetical protein
VPELWPHQARHKKWKGMKRPEKMAAVQRAAQRLKRLQKNNAYTHCEATQSEASHTSVVWKW